MKNIHLIPTDKPSRFFLNKVNGKLLLDSDTYCNLIKILPSGNYQHIYITSDEEIKEGVDQWYLDKVLNKPYNSGGAQYSSKQDVIILTTDQSLIKNGVQAIDDNFLEWFVKNPSFEEVDVIEQELNTDYRSDWKQKFYYKVIIPKEEPNPFELQKTLPDDVFYESLEPKQETLEAAVNKFKKTDVYINEIKQETLEEVKDKKYPLTNIMHFQLNTAIRTGFDEGYKFAQEQDQNKYSEEEVLQLIINCKERFGGSDLDDYVEDSKVIKWFEQFKKK